jgi:hypothetical protein
MAVVEMLANAEQGDRRSVAGQRRNGHVITTRDTTTTRQAEIVSAVRTAVGSFGGHFKEVPAIELAAQAVRAARRSACTLSW